MTGTELRPRADTTPEVPRFAVRLGDVVDQGFRGTATLYRLTPPIDDEHGATTEYVVASGIEAPYTGPETLVFASDESGHVERFHELAGGRGYIDPDRAIAEDLGYPIIDPADIITTTVTVTSGEITS